MQIRILNYLVKTLLIVLISMTNLSCLNSLTPMKIEGTAMLPNFKDGERVLVQKNFGEIKRGEIIFFHYPKNITKQYFKRVIGLPNETISIVEGNVFINDKPLDEPYLDQTYNQSKGNLQPTKIPEKSYFVLGDNRDNSSDSRSWGTVKEELIVGKHYLTY
jgi:signal peptidase I